MSDATTNAPTAPLLIELGCEEIPAGVAPKMCTALGDAITALLKEAELAFGALTVMGTPRRIAVHLADVQTRQPDRVEEITGPPANVAFQSCGTATRAGEGFARGQGMTGADLYTVTTGKGDYAALKKEIVGRSAADLLAEALPGILRGLPQPKKMRWLAGVEGFIRPVRWLVALLGEDVLDAEFAGRKAGRTSRGHFFFADGDVDVCADLQGYQAALRDAKVMVDPDERERAIIAGANAAAPGDLVKDADTLAVVTWLVEWPLPLVADFDPAYLEIPEPVVLTTLKSHQKLFCVRGADGKLLPCFVAVANTLTEGSGQAIGQGNTKVVAARLSDARFFYTEDLKTPLAAYVERLSGRIWLQGLGTVRDKVGRVRKLAVAMAKRLGTGDISAVERAALLCKADLETRMVGEFPGLQGVIGQDYARVGGESEAVQTAIREHYLPRGAGDTLPSTEPAALIAVADRLDSIVGCFSVGLVPTGAQDPYALRRAALGVLHILADRGWDIGLTELLGMARAGYKGIEAANAGAELDKPLLDFLRGRLRSWHQGTYDTDLVEAVLAAGFDRVATVAPRLQALAAIRGSEAFEPLAVAFKRVGNIVKKATAEAAEHGSEAPAEIDEGLFADDAERALHSAVRDVEKSLRGAVEQGRYSDALGYLSSLRPTVDRFFDDVMVMAEDAELRRNRLALMRLCGSNFASVADFTRIRGR